MEISDKVLQTNAQYSFDKFLKEMEEAAVPSASSPWE